jgi:predicted HTH domain antitoxin
MLVGEEVLRRLATGRADDPDWAKLKRLGITPVDTLSGILAELDDVAITAKAESAQAEFIEVAIELYQKYEFSVGRSVLRDTVCNKLAEDRWKRNETLHIQAKAPIELGWNFIAETERNITSGNKARIYERDGKIAIQHSQTLTPLHHWKMRCYQLFELMFNVCDDHRIHGQLNPKLTKWVKRFDK